MVPAALLPALALIAGAAGGIAFPIAWRLLLWPLPLLPAGAALAWRARSPRLTTLVIVIGFASAGAVLGAHAREAAIDTPLRLLLDREFGGFRIDALGVPAGHGPVQTRALLTEDASRADDVTTLRAQVREVRLHDEWIPVDGGVVLSVGGLIAPARADGWRRGRIIDAPVTFRRPARYLDDGVADFERQAALQGVTLLGSIKSGLLVDVAQHGTIVSEWAAGVRERVRRTVTRRVAPHSALSAAIVAAVLIGDRSGLPDEIRTRLQAAGTYHVIAISGGNIAILAAVILVALAITGTAGRPAALITLLLLIGYAQVVTAGPSVWRATLVALVYLIARLFDHRTGPWQAIAVAGALLACVQPLDVRDAGFILTFGATGALLELMRRGPLGPRSRVIAWLVASIAASAAVEIVLLPVMAITFSRVTAAGLLLNLAAVPLMAVVQIAGMAVACMDSIDVLAGLSGWIAHLAAAAIVESARLVEVAPWLTRRVPAPSAAIVLAYYAGLAAILGTTKITKIDQPRRSRRSRRETWLFVSFVSSWLTTATVIVTGTNPFASLTTAGDPNRLRLIVFDVGQGDAMVLEVAGRKGPPYDATLMIDTGGSPFGNGGFDIGVRIVEPALWARGIRTLQTVLLTHGDPDHIGGAAALVHDFDPRAVWQGVPVRRAAALQEVLAHARDRDVPVEERHQGDEFALGRARIRVLNPPPPDWERQRVRNDDSVVLEVVYGDVAILLTGDISAEVERDIAPRLAQAKTRILKVAHHGSRSSTSQELLDAWRPQIAVISCGRGNPFGHPAPEVVDRLTAIGASIYRTDRDGEITVDTNGETVLVTTYIGGRTRSRSAGVSLAKP